MVCGAGRVGIGQDGREHGFQISQRADYFEVEVGLETTLKRPIINTRDEPHADPEKYRRLHVILGDANLAEVSTYLKVGTTALVLAMIEDGFLTRDLTVDQPVASLRAVSHDPTLQHLLTLRDGRTLTAVQLQMEYLDLARKFVDDRLGDDVDEQTRDVLARWESVLTRLEQDPMLCAGELDWVAKLKLLSQYRDRDGLDWDDAKLHLIDLQYSDIRPEKGLYAKLVAAGRIERLLDDASVERAMHEPPEDTRAYFRGRCLEKYADNVAAASWDSVIFDLPGRESLQRVPTIDPMRGSKAHVGDAARPLRHRARALRRPHRPLSGRPPRSRTGRSPSGEGRVLAASVRAAATQPPATSSSTRERSHATAASERSCGTATAWRICMKAGSRSGGPGARRPRRSSAGGSRRPRRARGRRTCRCPPPRARRGVLEGAGQVQVVRRPLLDADPDAVARPRSSAASGESAATTYTPSIST